MMQLKHARDRSSPDVIGIAGARLDDAAPAFRQCRSEENVVLADAQSFLIAQVMLLHEPTFEDRLHVSELGSLFEHEIECNEVGKGDFGKSFEKRSRKHGFHSARRFPDNFEIVHGDLGFNAFGAPNHAAKTVGINRVVGIEHRDPATSRDLQSGVSGAAWTAILFQFDDADKILRKAAGHLYGTIARAIVGDHDFDGDVRAVTERFRWPGAIDPSALKAAMTKLTSGCIAARPRWFLAILAYFADAKQSADDTGMHDAAQRVAVATFGRDGDRPGGEKAVSRLGHGEPDRQEQASAMSCLRRAAGHASAPT